MTENRIPPDHDGPGPGPVQACMIFMAEDLYVSSGANLGDAMGGPQAMCAGDVYELADDAAPRRLLVARSAGTDAPRVARGSAFGAEGATVRTLSCCTLMDEDGNRVEVLVMAVDGAGLCVLLLSPMVRRCGYVLVRVEDAPQAAYLTERLCLSFGRGTMITTEGGAPCPIEALRPGMRVMTRDHGAQPVTWIGRATLRAVGALAPVVIARGALGNAGDLIVGQHHRMFLYQRRRAAGQPTAELLVQARHLVNGDTVFLREGGMVDYFALVFERHEIVYAEGIPTESLLVTDGTLQRLPADLSREMRTRFPDLNQNQHFGTETGRAMLDPRDAPMRGLRTTRPRLTPE